MSPEEARQQRAYGYVFQAAGLYPWRSIAKNVRLPLEVMGFDKNEMAVRVKKVLNLEDLSLNLNNLDFTEIKNVILRVDFNVPIDQNFIIQDFTRINRSRETIEKLYTNNCKILLLSATTAIKFDL